ncbi:MAG TPA: FtsH protease activity modulator HflK [Rickettsiales bacterium]|nr:FtsH protease activity modulator HflK [Rickettsiales bacterium]
MTNSVTIHNSEQGPWGKPRGSSGGSGGGWKPGGYPPKNSGPGDLDEMLDEVKKRFRELFDGEHGNRSILLALIFFVLLWLGSGIYQLQPGEQGVVLLFGKFDRIAAAGLRYHLPAPFESVEIVNSEAIRMVTLSGDRESMSSRSIMGTTSTDSRDDEILMLTGDENIINLSFNVQWKVRDAKDFIFNLTHPETTVRSVAESAMRDVIGRTPINAALTGGKLKVQDDVRQLMQETLDNYHSGIDIINVNMLDASFPRAVVDAARDVQAARADQDRARNEAEAYRNDIIPRARGKAQRIVQEAEGYKQEVIARAQGDAARFNSIYAQYKQAPEVTRERMYLESMERVMSDAHKFVVDNKAGVLPYLPLAGTGLHTTSAPHNEKDEQ